RRFSDPGQAEAPVADVAIEVEAGAALRATRQPQAVVEVARVQPAELAAQVPVAQRGRAGQLEAADARAVDVDRHEQRGLPGDQVVHPGLVGVGLYLPAVAAARQRQFGAARFFRGQLRIA